MSGQAGDGLLDSYESERRDHAKAMIDTSVMLKDLVSMTHPVGSKLRDSVIKGVLATPKLSTWAKEGGFKPAPVYTKGQYLGLARRHRFSPEGSLSPQPVVRRFDGRRVLLDSLLGEGYALVGLAVDPTLALSETSKKILSHLGCQFVTLYAYGQRPQGAINRHLNPAVAEVEDLEGQMVKWFKKSAAGEQLIAILRPDRFTFAVVTPENLNGTIQQLKQQLDWQHIQQVAPVQPKQTGAAV